MIRVGVIVPSRDRPKFLKHCLSLLDKQTLQPVFRAIMNYPPESEEKDITQRYRRGYDLCRRMRLDVIAFMEDDDWYSRNYLETMVAKWIKAGKPDLFGTMYTLYYHIKLRAHFTMHHDTRSSAMSTLIRPDLNFQWCPDHEAYTDSHLWFKLPVKKETFWPAKYICMGIKHGIGKLGGASHDTELHRYESNRGKMDPNFDFLRNTVDADSFEFYKNYFSE